MGMELMEMIFGYFLLWLIGALSILIGWGGGLVIRLHHPIDEPFVIYSVIAWEAIWLIAVLVFIFFPEFYEMIGNLIGNSGNVTKGLLA